LADVLNGSGARDARPGEERSAGPPGLATKAHDLESIHKALADASTCSLPLAGSHPTTFS
jgi:hypothetical protein